MADANVNDDALIAEFTNIMVALRAAYKQGISDRMYNYLKRVSPEIIGKKVGSYVGFGRQAPPDTVYWQDPYSKWYKTRRDLTAFFKPMFLDGSDASDVNSREYRSQPKIWALNDASKIAAYVEKEAEFNAATAFDGFVHKNVAKMSGILKGRKLSNITHSINGIDGDMFVKCQDGSSFRMSFRVEYATSKLGVFFARFPTRFHNVVKADGSKIASASEAKMKEDF